MDDEAFELNVSNPPRNSEPVTVSIRLGTSSKEFLVKPGVRTTQKAELYATGCMVLPAATILIGMVMAVI